MNEMTTDKGGTHAQVEERAAGAREWVLIPNYKIRKGPWCKRALYCRSTGDPRRSYCVGAQNVGHSDAFGRVPAVPGITFDIAPFGGRVETEPRIAGLDRCVGAER